MDFELLRNAFEELFCCSYQNQPIVITNTGTGQGDFAQLTFGPHSNSSGPIELRVEKCIININ